MSENEFDAAWEDEETVEVNSDPKPGSEEWHDHVLSLLTDDEKDEDNRPRCDGLRRIIYQLFDVIYSKSTERTISTNEVFVNWEVQYVARKQLVFDGTSSVQLPTVTISAFGSANKENTSGPFRKYLAAVADTRAEARCYRKALLLRGIASEEVINSEEEQLVGEAGNHQVKAVELMCKRNNINVGEFMRFHRKDISKRRGPKLTLESLTKQEAANAMNILNRYQSNNDHQIPEEIKEN